jgi:hypothetical protein
MLSFFLKFKAGAMPYHIRRSSKCTWWAKANTTTRPQQHTQTNVPNKTLHHLGLGEKLEQNHQELRRSYQCCATPKCDPLQSWVTTRTPPPRGEQPWAVHTQLPIPKLQPRIRRNLRRCTSAANLNARCMGALPHPHPQTRAPLLLLKNNHLKVYLAARYTGHYSKDPCQWNRSESTTYPQPKPRSP